MTNEPTPIAGLCPTWCTDHTPGDGLFGHHRRGVAIIGEAEIEIEVEQLANDANCRRVDWQRRRETAHPAEACQLAAALIDAGDINDRQQGRA